MCELGECGQRGLKVEPGGDPTGGRANDPLSAARHAGTGRETRARTATHSLPYLDRWASPMRDDPLLDAPTDPDQLYQYRGRGEVPLHRPWNQGDIVEHLQVRGGLVLDLAMLVAHPCSLRKGNELRPALAVAEVVEQRVPASRWPTGFYDYCPLPGFEQLGGRPRAALFHHLYTVDSRELHAGSRVAALSDYGAVVFLQRWIKHASRVTVKPGEIQDQIQPVLTEIALQEEWCAAALAHEAAADQPRPNDEVIAVEGAAFQAFLGTGEDSLRKQLEDPVLRPRVQRETLRESENRYPAP